MKILYIFPHPDDESFGPAHAMHNQRRSGHDVHLLTLTRGGATRQRHKYGHSVEQMGEIRYKEMLEVEKVLGLSGMTVLDLPDSGLKEMDPREIEKVIRDEISLIKPDVIVTYAVHGISGFHDHLVTHAAVKNVFCQMRDKGDSPTRLALFTITESDAAKGDHFKLSGSTDEEIDCVMRVENQDIEAARRALDCYVTFRETIEKTRIKEFIGHEVVFEIFQEDYKPPLGSLFESLS